MSSNPFHLGNIVGDQKVSKSITMVPHSSIFQPATVASRCVSGRLPLFLAASAVSLQLIAMIIVAAISNRQKSNNRNCNALPSPRNNSTL